jgi:uncharacterized phosphosugar-binding protein
MTADEAGTRAGAIGGLVGRWAATVQERTRTIAATQGAAIAAAGAAVARSLAHGGRVWVTQTSHTLHTELTGRAGGLVAVHALDDPGAIAARDTVLIGTTAGLLADPVETALRARAAGATSVALVQLAHEQDAGLRAQHPSGRRLHEVADIVVDLGGRRGDGEVELAGTGIAILPSSGVTGVFAGWLIMADAVERLAADGLRPLALQSILEDGAREANAARIERYRATGSGVEPVTPA